MCFACQRAISKASAGYQGEGHLGFKAKAAQRILAILVHTASNHGVFMHSNNYPIRNPGRYGSFQFAPETGKASPPEEKPVGKDACANDPGQLLKARQDGRGL